jgi:hypothetical protein
MSKGNILEQNSQNPNRVKYIETISMRCALTTGKERAQRAAESILENESLLEGLPTPLAETILNWGTSCAEKIAQDFFDLDDDEAETQMNPRMRALRQMLKKAGKFAVTIEPELRAALLPEILEQAGIVYGNNIQPPAPERLSALAQITGANAEQAAARLRELIDPFTGTPSLGA